MDDPRVYLAAERTFLAWVRTAVALMGFGFVVARFAFWMHEFDSAKTPSSDYHHSISIWLGIGMVIVGILVNAMAAVRHRAYIFALRGGIANPPVDLTAPMVITLVLGVVGLVMAVQLLLS